MKPHDVLCRLPCNDLFVIHSVPLKMLLRNDLRHLDYVFHDFRNKNNSNLILNLLLCSPNIFCTSGISSSITCFSSARDPTMFCVVFPATICSSTRAVEICGFAKSRLGATCAGAKYFVARRGVTRSVCAGVVSVTSGAGATYSVTGVGAAQYEDGADTTC